MKQIMITGVQAQQIQDDAKRVRELNDNLRFALEVRLRDLLKHSCLCNCAHKEIVSLAQDFDLDVAE